MTAERKIAYMAAIVDIWTPLLANGHVTAEVFKQEIINAVAAMEEIATGKEAA